MAAVGDGYGVVLAGLAAHGVDGEQPAPDEAGEQGRAQEGAHHAVGGALEGEGAGVLVGAGHTGMTYERAEK